MPYHVIKPAPRHRLTSDGKSRETAKTWDSVFPTGTGGEAQLISPEGYSGNLWMVTRLKAGVEYTVTDGDFYTTCELYDASGSSVAKVEWTSSDPYGGMPDTAVPAKITPSETGIYYIYLAHGMGDVATVNVTPRPEPYVKPEWSPYVTSKGFDARGYLIPHLSTFDANIPGGGIPQNGLIIHHPLTAWLDELPTGQPVTLVQTKPKFETYKGLACAYFEQDGGFSVPLPTGQDFSFSCWLQYASTDNDKLSICVGGQKVMKVEINYTRLMVGDYRSREIQGDDWHHICVTNHNGTCHIYIDGVRDGETSYIYDRGNSSAVLSCFCNLCEPENSRSYNGRATDLRLYNRILTIPEIASLYKSRIKYITP